MRSGVYEYRSSTTCKIALEAYDAASRRKLTERTYALQEDQVSRTLGSAAPASQWPRLSKILAAVVHEAVSDPALLEALR